MIAAAPQLSRSILYCTTRIEEVWNGIDMATHGSVFSDLDCMQQRMLSMVARSMDVLSRGVDMISLHDDTGKKEPLRDVYLEYMPLRMLYVNEAAFHKPDVGSTCKLQIGPAAFAYVRRVLDADVFMFEDDDGKFATVSQRFLFWRDDKRVDNSEEAQLDTNMKLSFSHFRPH